MSSFQIKCNNIISLQGELFHIKTELPFIYKVDNNTVWIYRNNHRINQNIDISNFKQVYNLKQSGKNITPGNINKYAVAANQSQVRGTSYVWAILNDHRI